MKKMLWALTLFALACAVRPAHAIPVEFEFTASGFFGSDTGDHRLPDPVFGTIAYELDPLTLDIIQLTSVDLNLNKSNGTAFQLGELDFLTGAARPAGKQVLGAKVNGIDQVMIFSDDFLLQWDQDTLTPELFVYTTHDDELNSFAATFLVQGIPVSEPATLPLTVLAMGLIAAFAGRHRKAGRAASTQTIASC